MCKGFIRLVAVGGFEREKLPFFRLARQILQSKSGIFDEKFNDERRKKGFFAAKGSHRNKSNYHLDRVDLTSARLGPTAGIQVRELLKKGG